MVVYSKVTIAPASEPLTASEAKTQLRVTSSADDTYITTLIQTARELCEKYSGLSFITQTRQIKLDAFPVCDAAIILPYGPVTAVSVGNFTYTNTAGGTTTMVSGTDYTLDIHSDLARLVPIDSWPTDVEEDVPNPISITYTAGYANAAAVPGAIKQAVLLTITSLYEDRMSGGLTDAAMALLDTVKVYHNAWQD